MDDRWQGGPWTNGAEDGTGSKGSAIEAGVGGLSLQGLPPIRRYLAAHHSTFSENL